MPHEWIRLLQQYVQEHEALPTCKVVYKGQRLGTWMNSIRNKKRQGQLQQEVQEELEKVPGWWWEVGFLDYLSQSCMCFCGTCYGIGMGLFFAPDMPRNRSYEY